MGECTRLCVGGCAYVYEHLGSALKVSAQQRQDAGGIQPLPCADAVQIDA